MPEQMPADQDLSLRAARIARLLSIRELAAKADVSTRTLQDLEQGRARPRFRTMRKLAAALEIAPEAIREFRTVIAAAQASAGEHHDGEPRP